MQGFWSWTLLLVVLPQLCFFFSDPRVAAEVAKIGAADIIVVGLQALHSLGKSFGKVVYFKKLVPKFPSILVDRYGIWWVNVKSSFGTFEMVHA